jgi:hypothetical protein
VMDWASRPGSFEKLNRILHSTSWLSCHLFFVSKLIYTI